MAFAFLLVGCTFLVALEGKQFAATFSFWQLALWASLAIMAERISAACIPVGHRAMLAVPFIAALSLTCGPLFAMMVSAGVLLASAMHGRTVNRQDQIESAMVGFAAAGAGAAALSGLQGFPILLQSLAFLFAWLMVRQSALLWASLSGSTISAAPVPLLVWAGKLSIAWLCTSAALGIVRDQVFWMSPLLLAPMLALLETIKARYALLEHYYGTIGALSQMLQRAHPYTQRHLSRVSEFAEQVALRLGLSPRRARMVREAALLHDIGKIAVDERILDKPGPLDDSERSAVQKHAASGAEILGHVEEFSEIAGWIRTHHERPDGKGYPDGLLDHQIPIESKIIAVADAFDAMTYTADEDQPRAYRTPVSTDEALDELFRCSGTQFDPVVVRAFRETVNRSEL